MSLVSPFLEVYNVLLCAIFTFIIYSTQLRKIPQNIPEKASDMQLRDVHYTVNCRHAKI